jgi:hypothetical protein
VGLEFDRIRAGGSCRINEGVGKVHAAVMRLGHLGNDKGGSMPANDTLSDPEFHDPLICE